jgi:hypothetical protein
MMEEIKWHHSPEEVILGLLLNAKLVTHCASEALAGCFSLVVVAKSPPPGLLIARRE